MAKARDLRLPAAHREGALPQAHEPAEHAAGAKDLRLPLHAPAGDDVRYADRYHGIHSIILCDLHMIKCLCHVVS